MGRPKLNTEKPEEVTELINGNYYDKMLVRVNREHNGKYAVTKSVTVMKAEQLKRPCAEVTAMALNRTQDWMNNSSEGAPFILWYFPHNTVKEGEEYKANDIQKTTEDEETGETFRITKHDGTPDLLGLNITNRKIKSWIAGKTMQRGKPVYFDNELNSKED